MFLGYSSLFRFTRNRLLEKLFQNVSVHWVVDRNNRNEMILTTYNAIEATRSGGGRLDPLNGYFKTKYVLSIE